MTPKLVAFLFGTALSLGVDADIYKCRLPDGRTEISNAPCAGTSGTLVSRPDETVSEAGRQQAERDVERMRDYVERREATTRAEAKAEREAQAQAAATQRQASSTARNYASPEECLRDAEQTAMEAGQRALLENECRRIVKPQTIYVPVPVASPVYRPQGHPYAPPVPPAPPRKKTEPPPPTVTLQPGKN